MRLLLFILILPISGFAREGEVGNGGDVVVCKDSHKNTTSVELLDIYEGRVLRDLDVSLGNDQLSVKDKIQIALARLKKISPKRVELYEKYSNSFHRETLFLGNVILPDISDSKHIILPNNCSIEQIVIHKNPVFPEDKRYIVSKDLWDLLDNNNKAALILHEIIYREALSISHKNSKAVRFFNSYLLSNKFEEIDFKRFVEILQKSKLVFVERYGINFQLFPEDDRDCQTRFCWDRPVEMSFYDSGEIESYAFPDDGGSEYKNGLLDGTINGKISFFDDSSIKSVSYSGPLHLFGHRLYLGNWREVNLEFFESGKIKKIHNVDHDQFKYKNLEIDLNGDIDFFVDQSLKKVEIKTGQIFLHGQSINLKRKVYFYPDATIHKAFLWGENKLLNENDEYVHLNDDAAVIFNKEGKLHDYVEYFWGGKNEL